MLEALQDLKSCAPRREPLPNHLKYAVASFWGVLLIGVVYIGCNIAYSFKLKHQLESLQSEASLLKDKYIQLEQVEKDFKKEEDKAKLLMQWLDITCPVHHLLYAMINDDFSQKIQCDKLTISFTEGLPQVHVSLDLKGNQEILLEESARLSRTLDNLGFRSISTNQPWGLKGMTYDSLLILPRKGISG